MIRHASHKGVPPVINDDSRVLVLGSMLSPKSAEAGFYYAHPQNRFWKVLAGVFGRETPPDRDGREALALSHGVALWDVICECDIVGAADSTIKNVVYNDISRLIAAHPNITRVFTTGTKAHELLLKYNRSARDQIIANATRLPSTSPQNCAIKLDELIKAYSVLKN